MRTSIDFPERVYREMKMAAVNEGTTMREIILEGVAIRLRHGVAKESPDLRPRFPVLASQKPGSLKLGEEGVYEYIPFP